MPRKRQIYSPIDPYHVYARSNNRDSFYLPMPEVWEIMSNYLHFIRFAYECRIHSFVLMPNHFHLICTFPKGNHGAAMNYFMRETSKEINRRAGRINHVFGSSATFSHINCYDYFMAAHKYVYRNPVKARICRLVEEYEYSTLHGLLGLSRIIIPVEEDSILFDGDIQENLEILNTDYTDEQNEAIRIGLHKVTFGIRKDRNTRKVVEFDGAEEVFIN